MNGVDMSDWEWLWYCRHCEEWLERGDDAVACEDAAECPASAEWGGDACGYIVHTKCHRPASQCRKKEKQTA